MAMTNPNQNREDFNFLDPFNINFNFEKGIDEVSNIIRNEIDNNNNNKIDIYDMMEFH